MTPSSIPAAVAAVHAGAPHSRAESLLSERGRSPESIPGAAVATGTQRVAAIATALMDEYRRHGDPQVFECLVDFVRPQLLARVRSRLRFLGCQLDPQEVLQDAIINIYRYPDKFDACRPGAFAAWSSTIVDNTIRRQLRRHRRGPRAKRPTRARSERPAG